VYSGGSVNISTSTVDRNSLEAAGPSAVVIGGIYASSGPGTIASSTISRASFLAKAPGAGSATAIGGGLYAGNLTIKDSTIGSNRIQAKTTGAGAATAIGGGGYIGSDSFIDTTVAGNSALASTSGGAATAAGGGLYSNGGDTLKASLVAANKASGSADCFGGPTSNGYNLIGKTGGCGFTKKASDIVNKDPKIGALANNGGPTQTMALAATSPAVDHIGKSACPLARDQRGVKRPQGTKCDIGAFERKSTDAPVRNTLTARTAASARVSPSVSFVQRTVTRALVSMRNLDTLLAGLPKLKMPARSPF
jgi:hypothetical protein